MRVTHVVPTYLPATRYGGPIIAVHSLCRALVARGHQVEVFTTSIDGSENSAVPHDRPVLLDGVKVRYFASSWLRRLSYAPAFNAAARREFSAADVVHLHSVFLWPTWRGAQIARRAGVPYVISPRGMLSKKMIASRNRLLKSAWIALLEKASLEHAAAIHVTSRREAGEIEQFSWRLRRVVTVPNAVEEIALTGPMAPSRDIAALADKQPLVVFLGRLARVKGLDRLLRAFARTKRGTLAVVGTDYDGLARELMRLAEVLHVAHRVHILPRTVAGDDKEYLFAAAKAVVLASHSESFGNVVVEALLRGVPVVVTPEVGAAEIVTQSGGGLVVGGDETALARALDVLTGDPARAAAMGETGRRHVAEHYGWPAVAAQMEALYCDIKAAS